ncbi:Hypothetical predicted protein [Lecanosticta acicola]|uniref:Serine hydrolase domain-containing protein n=1 Tax=Lecanosticta acicola TaxID=111012 RepID=A0AAI8YRN7_9PEZI|nr:Hypothetical predicted protein [Lecanosticta acicola]
MSGLRVLCSPAQVPAQKSGRYKAFRNLLPSTWRYQFYDGGEPCELADGIKEVYPGPYFCLYDIPSFENVQAAHDLVYEIIEDDGPFDAVMGYSQGASLLASILLHHQAENPYGPPLFRFAVFMNAFLPYSKNSDFGIDVGHMWFEDSGGKVFTPTDDDTVKGIERYGDYMEEGHNFRTLPIRRFNPSLHKDKINIPTAHLYGAKDAHRPQSLRLIEMCDEKQVATFEHCGRHEVPRTPKQAEGMATAIKKTFEKAQFIIA